MKVCRNCGYMIRDEGRFCERCGSNLLQTYIEPYPKQKNNNILIGIIILIILLIGIISVVFIVSRDDTPKSEIEYTATSEGMEKLSGQQETGYSENQNNYSDVDINGVDNVYINVMGVVEESHGDYVLKLSQAASVCAYDSEEEIVVREDVNKMILEGEDLEGILGAEVKIKGKLDLNSSGDFVLEVVNLEIEKEATAEEETDYEEHQYSLIRDDVTWQEAFEACQEMGGNLLQINSEEEFQHILTKIEASDMQEVHFYIGGRRNPDGQGYLWVNEENEFVGEVLNPEGNSWSAIHWMTNEPSFVSDGEEEMYMNLIYYKEKWVLNDVPMDITKYYPGKTGYICEFGE